MYRNVLSVLQILGFVEKKGYSNPVVFCLYSGYPVLQKVIRLNNSCMTHHKNRCHLFASLIVKLLRHIPGQGFKLGFVSVVSVRTGRELPDIDEPAPVSKIKMKTK